MSSSIHISDKDFEALAIAALKLFQDGDREAAFRLDDMARRANKALSSSPTLIPYIGRILNVLPTYEVESPLESIGKRKKGEKA